MPCYPEAEHIRFGEATGGTETSKYPEERKSTETPGVAASETGLSPNPRTCKRQGVAARGLLGLGAGGLHPRAESETWKGAERHGKAGRSG